MGRRSAESRSSREARPTRAGDRGWLTLGLALGAALLGLPGAVDAGWRVSPDGGEILLYLGERSTHADPEIYRLPVAEGRLVRVTESPARDYNPTWSPDGTRIAFYSDHEGDFDLYVMRRDGSGVRRIAAAPSYDGDPDWYPRGDRLVFTSDREDGNFEIWAVSLEDGDEAPLRLTHESARDHSPTVSPGGEAILFVSERSGSPEIWWMAADGSGQRQLTRFGAESYKPRWAADGDRFCFTSDREGSFDVWIARVSGGSPLRITDLPGMEWCTGWLPDGRLVLDSEHAGSGAFWVTDPAAESGELELFVELPD